MKKFTFNKVNEEVYYDKLSNGFEMYLYPTKKTKNFYITISVKYGSRVEEYIVDGKTKTIIPGSAHFLEHKVMALSENQEFSKRINDLGSIANAWTNSYGTNYNIFGSENIKENIKLLLDIFYNIDINEKNVNEEKGIIGEEIDMYNDRIGTYISQELFKNIFDKSYARNSVAGQRSDIEKINHKDLNRIYNDYYIPNNTFICVLGDFDKDEISTLIKEYIDALNLKEKELPKRIIQKESNSVNKEYELIRKNISNERVSIGYKIPKKLINIKDENILRCYLDIIFSSNFSTTSPLYEKYKSKDLFINAGYYITIIDDYIIININAHCKNSRKFIDAVSKEIVKLDITKSDFERKKKIYLKQYIVDFDNIEDIEYNICMSLMMFDSVDFNEYDSIDNMNYDEAKSILNSLVFDNYSIVKVK